MYSKHCQLGVLMIVGVLLDLLQPCSAGWAGWVIGGVVTVVAAPVVLPALGFTSVGIAAGSVGAAAMSTVAAAGGQGAVMAATVGAFQAAGTAGTAAVFQAGAAVGDMIENIVDHD